MPVAVGLQPKAVRLEQDVEFELLARYTTPAESLYLPLEKNDVTWK
jgi:hypothetical protein